MQTSTQSNLAAIREHMPIVCSNGGQFAIVDNVDGNYIKVTRDNAAHDNQHHWFPLSWVTNVDDKVHVDRPGDQAVNDWLNTDPSKNN